MCLKHRIKNNVVMNRKERSMDEIQLQRNRDRKIPRWSLGGGTGGKQKTKTVCPKNDEQKNCPKNAQIQVTFDCCWTKISGK